MDKFDLNDIECEYDVISGTEAAYVVRGTDYVQNPDTFTISGGPQFSNEYPTCGDCTCNKACDTALEYKRQDVEKRGEVLDKAKRRKATPIFSGVLMYFPDAIRAVAQCSQAGNDQHHPDKPLHWDRAKSTDELDALTRHLMQAGELDDDGIRHSAKVAWRALANLQKELEKNNEVEW